jgi:hypothetical protein
MIGLKTSRASPGFKSPIPIECDNDVIGHRQRQADFKLSAEDLPVRLSATISYSNLLPFVQITDARPFDCAHMHEHVGAAGVRLDKSKASAYLSRISSSSVPSRWAKTSL